MVSVVKSARRVGPGHGVHERTAMKGALRAGLLAVLTGAALAQPARPQAKPGPGVSVLSAAATVPANTTATVGATAARDRATCTQLPATEWLDADEFKLLAAHRGYKTVVFKVTYGACYEIYGYDRDGNLVEAYFNPVNARLMRSNRVQIAR